MSASCPTFGFLVTLDRDDGRTHGALSALLAQEGLSAEVVSQHPLVLAVTRDGSQTTDADRASVVAWAAGRASESVTVSDLVDLQELA